MANGGNWLVTNKTCELVPSIKPLAPRVELLILGFIGNEIGIVIIGKHSKIIVEIKGSLTVIVEFVNDGGRLTCDVYRVTLTYCYDRLSNVLITIWFLSFIVFNMCSCDAWNIFNN